MPCDPSKEAYRAVHGHENRFLLGFAEIHERYVTAVTRSLAVLSEPAPDTFLGRSPVSSPSLDDEPCNNVLHRNPTPDITEADRRVPIMREPLGGASGTLEDMLAKASGASTCL